MESLDLALQQTASAEIAVVLQTAPVAMPISAALASQAVYATVVVLQLAVPRLVVLEPNANVIGTVLFIQVV